MVLAVCCLAPMALAQQEWVESWASAQQLAEPRNSVPEGELADVTLRQIVHLSVGGARVRLRLSNRYGTQPVHFTAVHLARPTSPATSAIEPGSDVALTFSGREDVTVPAGADYLSDTVAFRVPALSDVAITLHMESMPKEQTGHPGSRSTSYLAHGDHVSAAEIENATKLEHWYFLEALEVEAPASAAAVVTLGDSITDGHGATTNENNRWPDVLARRLQANAATREIAVQNAGIGGNRLLHDGLGPNVLARFDHDVVAPPHVKWVIVLEGINDIGTLAREHEVSQEEHDELVRHMIEAYAQMVARAHEHGIKVYGATVMPFEGNNFYHPSAASEADRQAVNKWIREPGHFDAVIDFDKLTRDPENPGQMLSKFDSGDHLHPGPAGYAAMGEAIPLTLFEGRPAKAAHAARKAAR